MTVAHITGAARGIGKAIALRLAQDTSGSPRVWLELRHATDSALALVTKSK